MITINTEEFRRTALYFRKHNRYPDGVRDSYEWHEYWEIERDRCLEGYKVGDMKITGYHYWYLNHWPIVLTRSREEELYGEVFKNRRRGDRVFDFPDFWDVDWDFFTEFDLAIDNGEHFLVLKPRGTGFSNKGASMAGRNFFLKPISKNYLFADNKEFLLGDGIFNKFLDGRSHINTLHPEFPVDERIFLSAFGKPSDFKKDKTGMHFKATTDIDGQELGYKSEVIGVAIDADVDKVRGKRGELILLEEIGAMRKAETVYNIARSSVEQGPVTHGNILAFGTGGTVAAVFGDMEKMVYNPKAYNIRFYPNKWDEGMGSTYCSYFTPAYKSVAFKDKNGNSREIEAKKFWDKQRETAELSSDQNAIIQMKAENPYTIQEAILRTGFSVLPSNEAREWWSKVTSLGLHQIGIPGRLEEIENLVKFVPDNKLSPIYEYPHDPKKDLTGCIVQYYAPFKINGIVPNDLYIIALDPYAHDQSTDMGSIGAAYVYMQPNNIFPPGDRIVATYFGRPKTTDDFNRNLFMLADHYNAKIGFENDRGDTIGYAKRFRKLHRLEDEFELAFDADLKSRVKRGYGMHIGSGRDNLRKNKGDKYLADWLIQPRDKDTSGEARLTLHTIYCPGTLKEIDLYRPDGGNFDRISALRILSYHMKELVYKDRKPIANRPILVGGEPDLFHRRLF